MKLPVVGPLILLTLSAIAIPGGLEAQVCQNSRLTGTFTNLAIGAVEAPIPPLTGPFRRVFQVTFDGAGKSVVSTAYSSFNGNIFGPDTFTGTYTVAKDCTTTLNFNLPAPLGFTATFQGVLSSDFKKLDFALANVPSSAGGNLVSHMTKVNIKSCTGNEDLSGPYAWQMQGTVVGAPATEPKGDYSRFGLLIADGSGGFTANTNVNYNGLPGAEVIKGTYKVDTNCLLTLQYATPFGQHTVWGGLNNKGAGADLIQIYGPTQGLGPLLGAAPVTTGYAVAGSLYRAGN